MIEQPSVRDVLERAAEIIAEREKLGKRPAKAYVHAMPWVELVRLVR